MSKAARAELAAWRFVVKGQKLWVALMVAMVAKAETSGLLQIEMLPLFLLLEIIRIVALKTVFTEKGKTCMAVAVKT
jgi:hypothetical protein